MSLSIKFDIVDSFKKMHHIRIKAFEKTMTTLELAHGFPADRSIRPEIAGILRDQICVDTGIAHKYIIVERRWLKEDIYKVKFLDESAAVLFKLVYYGTSVQDNKP